MGSMQFFVALIMVIRGFSFAADSDFDSDSDFEFADATLESPIRVLSIDGGGVRGMIPAVILEKLEHDLGKPVSEIFDLITGTSTGGVIALGLTAPNALGKPALSAAQMVDFALLGSSRIFSSSWTHWVGTLGGLIGPKYETEGLQSVLSEILGDTKLSKALIPTLITGYHVEGESGVEFFSEDARNYPDKDCLMREVALASAAAPTFFEAVDVLFPWGKMNAVVDGGLYKLSPALLGYIAAKKLYPDREIEIYSLGTGTIAAEEGHEDLKGRGLLHWFRPFLRHLTNGGVNADESVLHKLLNEEGEERCFRLNVQIDPNHSALDDSSSSNLLYLHGQGLKATRSTAYKAMLENLRQY
jgi:hypothetical protein